MLATGEERRGFSQTRKGVRTIRLTEVRTRRIYAGVDTRNCRQFPWNPALAIGVLIQR